MSIFKSIEKGLLDNIHKRITMEQEFNETTLTYRTTTLVDDTVVHEHIFDLSPFMNIMEKRILEKLKKK